jgi:hypothetical protein
MLHFHHEFLDFREEFQQLVDYFSSHKDEDISGQLAEFANSVSIDDFHLNLSDIYKLDQLSPGHLRKIICNIPKQITSLHLNGNEFIANEESLRFIPKHITSLGFSFYGSKLGDAELIRLCAAIPHHIGSVDLSNNRLAYTYAKNQGYLKEALAKLPKKMIKLDFRGNGFEGYTNDDRLYELFADFPNLAIRLEDRTFHMLAEKLTRQVKDNIPQDMSQGIFEVISPNTVIDEADLQQFVHALEEHGTSMAYLTAGLLLECRMGHSVANEEKDDSYIENRIQGAITFYVKAAEDPEIKPLVDFILWEMKTTKLDFPSIPQRLAELDINPGKFVGTYASYQSQKQVVARLYWPFGIFQLPSQINEDAQQTTSEISNNNQM